MNSAWICPSCGHDNRTSSRFCAECGSSLQRHCPHCSESVAIDARFCDGCGTRIDTTSVATSPPSQDVLGTLERRQMTVMFCDLRGSTQLSEQLDPEDLRRVLRLYQDSCASVIQYYDGYVSQYLGDGILTLFGYPTAHDNDAYRAVRSALDIIDNISSLTINLSDGPVTAAVRIGIATGVVVAGDVIGNDYSREQAVVGNTPNLASRMQAVAETNAVVISESTHRLVKNRFHCKSLGLQQLHGIKKPSVAYRVLGNVDPLSNLMNNIGAASSRLVGRDREIAQLTDDWKSASAGNGRVVLIEGEAGIGKTRLVQELRARIASEAHQVLEARCSSYLTNSSLHPVFELLRARMIGDESDCAPYLGVDNAEHTSQIRDLITVIQLAARIREGSTSRGSAPIEQPFDEILQLLKLMSIDRPLLIVVEDSHWADPSTRQLLSLLIKRTSSARILIIITSRTGVLPEWLDFGHTSRIELDRLGPEQTEEIIHARTLNTTLAESLLQTLVRKSDGVPLFIEELTQSILDRGTVRLLDDVEEAEMRLQDLTVPDTLRDSLMARLDQLGEAKIVAQLGAVIGREFTHELLSAVTDIDEQHLNAHLSRLVGSALVLQFDSGSKRTYRFKHSLIQDTAYDSLINSRKIEFHSRIASTMETHDPEIGQLHPELMARHYAMSSQPVKAVEYWNRACERSLQQSANIEALHHANEGLRNLPKESDDGGQRDLLALSLYIHLSAAISGTKGDADPEVEAVHQKAAALLERIDSRELTFQLANKRRAYYHLRGPLERAVELGNDMLHMAEADSDPQTLTDSWRSLGWTYICFGELERGQALIRKALSTYDKGDSQDHTRHDTIDPGGVGTVNLAWSEWLVGRAESAATLAREAIALSREIDHSYTLSYALCMAAAVFQCRREPEVVLPLVDEAILVAKKRDYRYWVAWGESLKGWAIARLHGDDHGLELLTDSLVHYRNTGATLFEPHILCMLAGSLYDREQHSEARRRLELAACIESRNQIGFYSAETQRLLGVVTTALDDPESAAEHFRRALTIARTQNAGSFEIRTASSIVRCSRADALVSEAEGILAAARSRLRYGQHSVDEQLRQ